MVAVGEDAPTIEMHGFQRGKGEVTVSLSEYADKAIILYFYPKNNTKVCTAEACLFRDNLEAFNGMDAVVIGVSADSLESHQAFAEKHSLDFILVSDASNEVRTQFGVPKSLLGFMPGRVTYLIKDGKILHISNSTLSASAHVEEAKRFLQSTATST